MKSGTITVLGDGSLRVIDPDRSMLNFLVELEPDFRIQSDPQPVGFIPAFQRLRERFICGLSKDELQEMQSEMAIAVHNAAINKRIPLEDRGEVSILDLKVQIGEQISRKCNLCGWACKANRYEEPGKCGARAVALFNGIFEHICEEAPINPAWNLKLTGCPMRCAFCQTPENLDPGEEAKPLGPEVWEVIRKHDTANTIEFVGGEPGVSVGGILRFLSFAPEDLLSPIVMNCSLYLSNEAVNLMDGVVDVWMPDFTYGNNECAERLSGVPLYWETATQALSLICRQEAKVLVRLLVLPGHSSCCHKKVLDWLSRYNDRIWVSIMDQYLPFHRASLHEEINRMPGEREIREVRLYAKKVGLRDINEENVGRFWR